MTDINRDIESAFQAADKSVTDQAVNSLIDAAKLSLRDAKTCIYWRLGTNYLEKLEFYPTLALVGPAGSGKNTIMKALRSMSGRCSGITDCGSITPATARDELAKHYESTFFADEFDEIRPEVERIFMSRTTRSMSDQVFKKQYKPGDYRQVTLNIFGATAVHKRNLIDDPALSSRSLQIYTRHAEGPYGVFNANLDALEALTFDMSEVKNVGGRIETTWSPILEIARQLGDIEYLAEIEAERVVESKLLRQKAEYDYSSVVLAKVVEILAGKILGNRWERIDIEETIGKDIRRDYPNIAPITLNSIMNNLGFFTERRGGRRWLTPELAAIKFAALRCNYQDEWIDTLEIGED